MKNSTHPTIALATSVVIASAACMLIGCGDSKTPTPTAPTSEAGHDHEGHDHEGHDHAESDAHDDHGPATALGEQKSGGFTIKASREGDVKAGAELAVDVDVTTDPTGKPMVAAVRFWIGAKDGQGSMKAKGELEHDTTWHAHTEVPTTLAADAMLWVEVETEDGLKTVVSFDLKR